MRGTPSPTTIKEQEREQHVELLLYRQGPRAGKRVELSRGRKIAILVLREDYVAGAVKGELPRSRNVIAQPGRGNPQSRGRGECDHPGDTR